MTELPQTHNSDLPAFPSLLLGLQVCATMNHFIYLFLILKNFKKKNNQGYEAIIGVIVLYTETVFKTTLFPSS